MSHRLLAVAFALSVAACAAAPHGTHSARATIYFSAPDGSKVQVFGYMDKEEGRSNTDFVEMPEPVVVLPGAVSFSFMCPPNGASRSSQTSVVQVPHPGTYYLYCAGPDGELTLSARN